MRRLLIPIAMAAAALPLAIPAMAEERSDPSGFQRPGGPFRPAINELLRDLNRAENRIDRSVAQRMLSPREGAGLRRQADQIRLGINRALRNGISGREFGALRAQVNRIGSVCASSAATISATTSARATDPRRPGAAPRFHTMARRSAMAGSSPSLRATPRIEEARDQRLSLALPGVARVRRARRWSGLVL